MSATDSARARARARLRAWAHVRILRESLFFKKKSPLYSDSDFYVYTVRIFWALTVFYFENFVSRATCLRIAEDVCDNILAYVLCNSHKKKLHNFFENPL